MYQFSSYKVGVLACISCHFSCEHQCYQLDLPFVSMLLNKLQVTTLHWSPVMFQKSASVISHSESIKKYGSRLICSLIPSRGPCIFQNTH